jgi:hypothetical protein
MFMLQNWKLRSENKYIHLLVFLVLFFLTFPFIKSVQHNFEWVAVLFFFAIALTLWAQNLRKNLFLACIGIGEFALALGWLSSLERFFAFKTTLAVSSLSIYAVFMIIAIVVMLGKMFSTTKVTVAVMRGGISLYLMLGYLWVIFYYIIYHFDPHAFHSISTWKDSYLFYFSFSTLTTVGYGDISPANNIAMGLANLEAITGQLYIGIFVARLVGLHIIHQSHKSP